MKSLIIAFIILFGIAATAVYYPIQHDSTLTWDGTVESPLGVSSGFSTRANPSGGSTGDVLTKNSGTDYDYSWTAPSGGGSTQGSDVTAANPIAFSGGTVFEITGSETITQISNIGWSNGNTITLILPSGVTIEGGDSNSGTDIACVMDVGSGLASGPCVVTLVLAEVGGDQKWRQVSYIPN